MGATGSRGNDGAQGEEGPQGIAGLPGEMVMYFLKTNLKYLKIIFV